MKKQILYGLLLLCCLFLPSCSEDKGNYDYTNLNDVQIAYIEERAIAAGSIIQITPGITRSLDANEKNLSFQWEIDGKVISTERDLNMPLPPMTYGKKACGFIVTDNSTGMKYIQSFSLNIVNLFNYGYYFLTRQQDGTTVLSYLPSFREGTQKPEFMHTTTCGDVTFGKEPSALIYKFGYIDAIDNYFWTLTVISKEGNTPVLKTDNGTFLPTSIISEINFIDKEAGYRFKPEEGIIDVTGREIFLSNGEAIVFSSSLLYRPAQHKEKYHWSHMRGMYTSEPILWIYDDISSKFYVIRPQQNNPELGIIGDQGAYDEVLPITDSPSLKDETLIALSKPSNDDSYGMIAYTASSKGINIYKYGIDEVTENFKFMGSETLPISGANAETKSVSMSKDCFFSIGNQIYITPIVLPKLSEFITIDAKKYGKIATLGLSSNATRLIVTTYDKESSNPKKGSVIFVNIQTKQITEEYPNSIEECVSIAGANADIWGQTGGLGDDK